jgi:hypothetical protein
MKIPYGSVLRALGSLNPAQAERMAGRIRVDLKVVERLDVCRLLQDLRAKRHDTLMCSLEVIDPEVEVDLLRWSSSRPVRWNMIGCELYPDPRFTVDDDHVPVLLGVDDAAEHPGPECALGRDVRGVEYYDLMLDAHSVILSRRPESCSLAH